MTYYEQIKVNVLAVYCIFKHVSSCIVREPLLDGIFYNIEFKAFQREDTIQMLKEWCSFEQDQQLRPQRTVCELFADRRDRRGQQLSTVNQTK